MAELNTYADKVKELNRRIGPIDPMTFDSLGELRNRPKDYVSREVLAESARKIRKSVIRLSRELGKI